MNDLISIIIPVYNMEKYLERCLDSVINQSYKNIEILLIDDGSTDSSSNICLRYSKMDSRIKYYKKENGGLSSARNYGLERISGDYIGFVDSDDIIHKDMYMILYNNLRKNNASMSICEVDRFTSTPSFSISDYDIYSKEDILKIILEDKMICNFAVNKLYSKKIIKDIRYPLNKVQEDVGTTYKFILNSEKIVYTKSKLYGYYSRGNSISKSLNKKFIYDYFEMIEKRALDLNKYNVKDYVKLNKVNVILGMFIDLSLNKILLKDKELDEYMNHKLKELSKINNDVKKLNTKKHNILISILLFNKNIFFLLMSIYLKIKTKFCIL